jgi:hypothetical protein
MAYLIGVDEAGYGPNLGPLIVAATVWELPEAVDPEALDTALHTWVARPGAAAEDSLVVGDSKQLYQSGSGLDRLELAVLGAAARLGLACGTWRRLWQALVRPEPVALRRDPWYAQFDLLLPVDSNTYSVLQAACRWHAVGQTTGIRLRALRVAAVFPGEWNQQLQQLQGKGELLTRTTLELVRDCAQQLPPGPLRVHCDKHGGRNRYGPLLQQIFPEYLVEVRRESRPASVYQWGPAPQRCEIHFTAKGERCPASGLASMVAKYFRELAMRAFNNYWQQQLPTLRPTAGYPSDARRFWKETESIRHDLQVDEERLWRRK